jgi:hypothetical protein
MSVQELLRLFSIALSVLRSSKTIQNICAALERVRYVGMAGHASSQYRDRFRLPVESSC